MRSLFFAGLVFLISSSSYGAVQAVDFSITLDAAASKALYEALKVAEDQLTLEGGGARSTKELKAAGIKCTQIESFDTEGKAFSRTTCTVASK